MGHLLYLMFRCDEHVMKSLESLEILWELNTAKAALPLPTAAIWQPNEPRAGAGSEP